MRFFTLFIISLSVLTTLTACSNCSEDRTRIGLTTLNENLDKWNSFSIGTYVLTYSRNGSFLPPSAFTSTRVLVESGEIAQVEILDNDGSVIEQVPQTNFSDYFSVESLFEEITLLDSTVKDLEVLYNQDNGLPSTVSVNPNIGVDGCGDVSDDEYTIAAQVEY